MSGRPVVSVFNHAEANTSTGEVRLPGVFSAPLRPDVVSFVHDNLSKNSRQAHGINFFAGMKHSSLSWGTGRAVARIPRIRASGTGRANQGANGNMCRAGRMAFPLRTWRRWHRKVNLRQRRHALAAAIASSAVTPLVLARGHRVMEGPQLPLVFGNDINNVSRTKEVVAFLTRYGVQADIDRVISGKALRAGKGKMRNRRFKTRRGPLFIGDESSGALRRAMKNVQGVDFINVQRLNIKHLAPGGHLGRFCIFTESAFKALTSVFGGQHGGSTRQGYSLLSSVMTNADVAQIINSNEVQSVVRAAKVQPKRTRTTRKNPLNNKVLMAKLNPYSTVLAAQRAKSSGAKKAIAKADKSKFRRATRLALEKNYARVHETVEQVEAEYTELVNETKL